MGSYKHIKELFIGFNNMTYLDFEQKFNENSIVKLNKKLYDKIMSRVKYFINKTKRL
jgi:hypothetical protein